VFDAADRRAVTRPAFSRVRRALGAVLGVAFVDRGTCPSGPSNLLLENVELIRRFADDERALRRDAQSSGFT